jgi:hypothetical protein
MSLKNYTLGQLRKTCKIYKLKGYSRLNKKKLIPFLKSNNIYTIPYEWQKNSKIYIPFIILCLREKLPEDLVKKVQTYLNFTSIKKF